MFVLDAAWPAGPRRVPVLLPRAIPRECGRANLPPWTRATSRFRLPLLMCVGVMVYGTLGCDLVASGDLAHARKRRRMNRRIAALRDHFVLCGFGRVGRVIVSEYRKLDIPVVVIEIDPRSREELHDLDVPYLIADPQNDGVLEGAGIEHARGLICAVDTDAINAFIA